MVNLLDPDVIVLGGGLSKLARLYANVPALWGAHVFSDTVRTRLVPPRARRLGRGSRRRLAVGPAVSVTPASARLHLALLAGWAILFVLTAWSPKDRLTWVLEVAPAVAAVVAIAAVHSRWRFTPLVLVLVFLHCAVLMVGAKYTYAEVPWFSWLRDEFGLARNYYDRVGHFAQGFVPAMVAREILLRNAVLARGRWLFFLVTCVCLAISADLRAGRVVGGARHRRGGAGLPRHPGRRLGHAVGHVHRPVRGHRRAGEPGPPHDRQLGLGNP